VRPYEFLKSESRNNHSLKVHFLKTLLPLIVKNSIQNEMIMNICHSCAQTVKY